MKQVASLKYGVIFKKAFFKPQSFTTFIVKISKTTEFTALSVDEINQVKS